nr:hypothetical protein [Tanacetum cinerariifolium]
KGVGFVSYNAVPPPLRGLFSPPKLDLSNSGLEEFQQPKFEGYGPKTSNSVSKDISNEVKESPDAPLVKELVSDDKLEKKTVFLPNQSNGSVGKARVEKVPDRDYILLPLWTQYPLFSSSSKDSPGDGFKPLRDVEKKDAKDTGNEDNDVLRTKEPRVNQEKDVNVNSTNNINPVSPNANAASTKDNVVDEDIVYGCKTHMKNTINLKFLQGRYNGCVDDLNMPNLEDIVHSNEDEDVGAEADMTNLDTNIC